MRLLSSRTLLPRNWPRFHCTEPFSVFEASTEVESRFESDWRYLTLAD
jgi:hypothetical protein